MNSQSYRRIHEKGQALVETALVLLVLFFLVFGIIEFGRAMYTKNTLTNSARAGARQAVVTLGIADDTKNDLTTALDCPDTPNDCVYKAVRDSLFAGIEKANVSVTISGGTGTGDIAVTNDAIKIEVTLNTFSSVVPKMLPFPTSLKGEATMRYE